MAFTHVTMQSEKYVCVRETGTTNNVVIVDMANPSVPLRKPITADSTIIAPSSKILALKAATAAEGGSQGDNLQVFNLDTKQKVRAYLNPVKVQFWAWISDDVIALVTDSAVFHWDVNVRSCSTHPGCHCNVLAARSKQRGQSPVTTSPRSWVCHFILMVHLYFCQMSQSVLFLQSPEPPSKVFDRTPNLSGTQIISYRVSPDLKWSTLVGIAPGSAEKCALLIPQVTCTSAWWLHLFPDRCSSSCSVVHV